MNSFSYLEASDGLKFTCIYLSIHFIFYLVVGRRIKILSREWVILSYHVISLFLLLVGFLWLVVPSGSKWPLIIATFCLHGIYSLSFLELWSLSDGGYSLRILQHIDETSEQQGSSLDLSRFEKLGVMKKEDRLMTLFRLRLIKKEGAKVKLSALGTLVTAMLVSIRKWVAYQAKE